MPRARAASRTSAERSAVISAAGRWGSNCRRSAPMAYVDPDSADVQRLKYAALPLIMRLNDDQKREVKSLAYVMGLGSVASGF